MIFPGLWPEKRRIILRFIRRTILLLLAAILVVGGGCYVLLDTVLNGPSPEAADRMEASLMGSEKTDWIPGLIRKDTGDAQEETLPEPAKASSQETLPVVMEVPESAEDEWADYPDGIRIDRVEGDSYKAYAMMIRDPSRVYLGLSNNEGFSPSIPGKRINEAMESEGAAAAINSGAFFDDGTSKLTVGATPQGLVMSAGKCVWQSSTPPKKGFAGFDNNDKLIVVDRNIKKAEAEELNIRDGCCFGPALIIDGVVNDAIYVEDLGWEPRTAIGQRADGTVIFLCIDGRQAASIGATFPDIVDVMQQLGAVNACNMDGGSSTVMMYRDTLGKYGEADQVYMVNSYSQLQEFPRRMPDYWMVRPMEKEG